MSDDPKEIFLQPECCADPAYGRTWCEDDAPVDCEDGVPWTKYVRADVVERLRAELEQRTAAVIVSERGQALACSASVAAAYGTLRAELADCRMQLDASCNAEELRQVRAERDALRKVLMDIREATHKSALTLRGMAHLGLDLAIDAARRKP